MPEVQKAVCSTNRQRGLLYPGSRCSIPDGFIAVAKKGTAREGQEESLVLIDTLPYNFGPEGIPHNRLILNW
jgi:hypothetical protein